MLVVEASASPIGFAPVKAILTHFELDAQTSPDYLRASFRIFHPLDVDLAKRVRSSASLTDTATPDEQIRFFQAQRANRSFVKLADHIKSMHPDIAVTVSSSFKLDRGSQKFFDIAARVSGWKVTYSPEAIADAITYQPAEDEQRILNLFSTPHFSVKQSQDAAFEFINVGDAWTAVKLGAEIQKSDSTPRTWNILALAHAMLDETLEAEFYYNQWAEAGTPLDRVRAMYGMSMLYARHHPKGLLSISKSTNILEAAHGILSTLAQDERGEDSVVFDEVFNRNGFALTLFRRGDVPGATEMLRWGIATLEGTSEKIAIHRTVLIYNLAQCLKQSGDLVGAINTYEYLLSIDPNMPEYHLEFAKCLAAVENYDAALDACKRALDLDDTISAGWATQGLYLHQTERHDAAVRSLREATRLDPDSISSSLDLAYVLAIAGSYEDVLATLERWKAEEVVETDAERLFSLLAEAQLSLGNTQEALNTLMKGLERYPGSQTLRKNHHLVSEQYA